MREQGVTPRLVTCIVFLPSIIWLLVLLFPPVLQAGINQWTSQLPAKRHMDTTADLPGLLYLVDEVPP